MSSNDIFPGAISSYTNPSVGNAIKVFTRCGGTVPGLVWIAPKLSQASLGTGGFRRMVSVSDL
jgi:hypothetical protein